MRLALNGSPLEQVLSRFRTVCVQQLGEAPPAVQRRAERGAGVPRPASAPSLSLGPFYEPEDFHARGCRACAPTAGAPFARLYLQGGQSEHCVCVGMFDDGIQSEVTARTTATDDRR